MAEPGDVEAAEADVLVIGAGPSGLAAAHTAAEHGASVTLVDATGEIGGNGAFSTGYLAFAGTSMQRELGITDDAAAYLADLLAEVERKQPEFAPEFDLAVARRFTEESAAAFDYLRGLGFEFARLVSRPIQHTTDRTVVMSDPTQFRTLFQRQLDGLGVTVLLRRRARELLRDGAGPVTGARVETPNGTVTEIRARRGVVLTTGGYQASAEMRGRYRPGSNPHSPFPGLESDVGDGQLMVEKVGGDLMNMHMVPEVVLVASRLVEECIAITEDGARFHDEAGPEATRLRALRAQPGEVGYYLCDARTARTKAQLIADIPGQVKTFGSLAAVARAVGAAPRDLEETVRRWNATVDSGVPEDPEFGRVVFPDPRIGIVEPPFTVAPMVVGTNMTAGGARVSVDMQVLDGAGRPVPGLFAAGDCAGAVNAAIGIGGLHLAAGVTLGRVAGRSAARCGS